jgi:hypothetical protein
MPKRQRHIRAASSDNRSRIRRPQMFSMESKEILTLIPLKTLEDLIAVHLNATSWSNDDETLKIKMDLPEMVPMKITIFRDKKGGRIGT